MRDPDNVSFAFADSALARVLSLLLAALIGWLLYTNWADDFRQLFQGETPALPIVSKSEPVVQINTALQACLEKRIGDVDRMKEEGVLSDAQYEDFKANAEQLCRQQNPG